MIEWYYFAIASGLLLAFAALIEKHMLNHEHATSFTAITTIVSTIFSLVLLVYSNFSISITEFILIYIASTFFLANGLLVARLYRHSEVSSVNPITSTLPILFLTVLTFIFINEVLTLTQYLGIVVLVAAIYLMLSDSKKTIPVEFLRKNIQYFIVAALFYSIAATILKYTLSAVSPYTFLVLSSLFMSVDMLIFVFVRFRTFKYIIRDVRSYKLEVTMFSIASVGYGLFYYLAVAQQSVSLVFPLRSGISVLLAVFASGILLKEKVVKRIPLAIIMVIAMYLLIR